ncbi:MAG: lipopolysaccharide heptosyltransferase II [Bacteroidota bacterium]
MRPPERILVFQTAFLGDVILTLPLMQVLRSRFPKAHIACVTIPGAAPLLAHHTAVDECIEFDKRGIHRGIGGIIRFKKILQQKGFDLAMVPHRSLRSAAVVRLAGVPRRVGFSTSAGRMFLTDVVRYDPHAHEISRNLSLLGPLGIDADPLVLPTLFPGMEDKDRVNGFLAQYPSILAANLVGVAPGSVWNTKRWPIEKFVELVRLLGANGFSVVLIGGEADRKLADEIEKQSGTLPVLNAVGKLTLLQSAELIRRCRAIVSNDSAPMHMAVAMRTPVVGIFGATVPEFGFAPAGEHDVVVQTHGLPCRPCSIHGGEKCPIKTFVCMKNIAVDEVMRNVQILVSTVSTK